MASWKGVPGHYLLRESRGLSFFGGEPRIRNVRGKGWCFSTRSSVFPSDVTFLTVDRPSLPHVRQFTVPFRSHSEGSTLASLPRQYFGISFFIILLSVVGYQIRAYVGAFRLEDNSEGRLWEEVVTTPIPKRQVARSSVLKDH